MRLRPKFSLIVIINALAITLLVFVSVQNSKNIQSLKQYQHEQSQTQAQLSNLLLYLIKFDYQPSAPKTAFREWDQILKELDNGFTYLGDPKNTKNIPEEITGKISEINTLWESFKKRSEPISEAFQKMQEIKYSQGDNTAFTKQGIRLSYEKYPESKSIQQVYNYLVVIDKQLDGITTTHTTLSKLNNETALTMDSYIEKVERKATIINMIIALISIIASAVSIIYLTDGITNRIRSAQKITSTMAKKDFSKSIKAEGNDEIKDLMLNIDHMENEIKKFFVHVKESAIQAVDSGAKIEEVSASVSVATQNIDHNIHKMTGEFEAISESVATTTDAMEQMALQIETLVMNNSLQTSAVQASGEALDKMVVSLGHINKMAQERAASTEMMHTIMQNGGQKITATSNLLNEVTKQLDEVKAVVTLINNVAHQTNLLSMNAAIEAAHAGELGQGFSVVAEEIRSLAEETSINAKKISLVVKNIVEAVNMADESSATAKAAFEEVTVSTAQVIASLKDISGQIDTIDTRMQEVHAKSAETATAAEKINTNCITLSEKQDIVSIQATNMSNLIKKTTERLAKIKDQTGDIVNRVYDVTEISKDNTMNMGNLEAMLEEFKTEETAEAASDAPVETASASEPAEVQELEVLAESPSDSHSDSHSDSPSAEQNPSA